MEYDNTLRKVIEFHGHVCPGLAYGYRAAQVALRELGDRSEDEEIVAVVENDSCSVDAIQVMTGCTFGKGNLIFRDFGKQVYTFFKRSTGKGLRISVDYTPTESPEDKKAWERYLSGERSTDVVKRVGELKERKVEEILGADEQQILSIHEVEAEPPPMARIHPSLRCEKCGEKVMSSRIREDKGRKLCIPCSE
ncbi:MAG: FmdE family protein [bacterium]